MSTLIAGSATKLFRSGEEPRVGGPDESSVEGRIRGTGRGASGTGLGTIRRQLDGCLGMRQQNYRPEVQ
jgi:hypothetical protein